MSQRHVISVKANIGTADVKRSGRSQSYMPFEAAHALAQAQKAQKTLAQ